MVIRESILGELHPDTELVSIGCPPPWTLEDAHKLKPAVDQIWP